MKLSLVVDNSEVFASNPPYSYVVCILDMFFDSYRDSYVVAVLLNDGGEFNYIFPNTESANAAIDAITNHIVNDTKRKYLSLAHSAPKTWLEVAMERVAKGVAATSKERKRNNKSITRHLR